MSEALTEALIAAEMEPALLILAEALDAEAAGFCRFPRTSVGEVGQVLLAGAGRTEIDKPISTFEHAGAFWMIALLNETPWAERGAAAIAVRRKEDFAKKDRTFMEHAGALFAGAHRRITRFESITGQNTGLTALIEKRLGACAALATPRGDMLWMSQSARDILGEEGRTMLADRVRSELKELVRDPKRNAREFVINIEGKSRLFGEMLFVRESAETSVHYIAVELHGSDVETHADAYKLTRSEREVLKLIKQGLSNDEIAKARFVSVETVRSHVKAVFRKMNVSSRVELLVQKTPGKSAE